MTAYELLRNIFVTVFFFFGDSRPRRRWIRRLHATIKITAMDDAAKPHVMPYGSIYIFLGCCGRARGLTEKIITHKLIYVNVKLFVPLNYFTDVNGLCLFFFLFVLLCRIYDLCGLYGETAVSLKSDKSSLGFVFVP